jgi:acyl carrier protein
MEDIKLALREIFVQALRLHTDPGALPDENLVHSLGIDSISSLEILIWVEDHFKIRIEDQDLSPKLVDSLDKLASFIQECQKNQSSEGGSK